MLEFYQQLNHFVVPLQTGYMLRYVGGAVQVEFPDHQIA